MEKVNVGDKVHIGHAKKGGAGYSGTVTKIEGTKVWIKLKDDQKRTVVGQMKNLTKESENKTSNTIKKSELKEIIKSIIKSENVMEMAVPKGKILTEAKAPTNSVFGVIGRYLWSDFIKTVKSKSGKLTWVDNRAISMAIWMATFEGYTPSDVSFDGTLTMYFDKEKMHINLVWNDAYKGGNEKKWEIKHFEDVSTTAIAIGKHLKQWQEI